MQRVNKPPRVAVWLLLAGLVSCFCLARGEEDSQFARSSRGLDAPLARGYQGGWGVDACRQHMRCSAERRAATMLCTLPPTALHCSNSCGPLPLPPSNRAERANPRNQLYFAGCLQASVRDHSASLDHVYVSGGGVEQWCGYISVVCSGCVCLETGEWCVCVGGWGMSEHVPASSVQVSITSSVSRGGVLVC